MLAASMLLLVVACDGLGRFTLSLNPSSAFQLTVSMHEEMAENDHNGLFLVLSAGLFFAAVVGFVPFKSSFVYLLGFSLLLGFTVTKATLGWAFPLSMVSFFTLHIL